MDFHPCDIPRGMKPYNLTDITEQQQRELNIFKLNQLRNDHSYLKDHPEIQLITDTLIRAVLEKRPLYDLKEFFYQYVINNRSKLEQIIEEARSGMIKSDDICVKSNLLQISDDRHTE